MLRQLTKPFHLLLCLFNNRQELIEYLKVKTCPTPNKTLPFWIFCKAYSFLIVFLLLVRRWCFVRWLYWGMLDRCGCRLRWCLDFVLFKCFYCFFRFFRGIAWWGERVAGVILDSYCFVGFDGFGLQVWFKNWFTDYSTIFLTLQDWIVHSEGFRIHLNSLMID